MRMCPHCRGTGVVETPKHQRQSKAVREMRKLYPDIPAFLMICPDHGLWLTEFDHLFPYHWEMNKCNLCK